LGGYIYIYIRFKQFFKLVTLYCKRIMELMSVLQEKGHMEKKMNLVFKLRLLL
jgi:hypothetical protein